MKYVLLATVLAASCSSQKHYRSPASIIELAGQATPLLIGESGVVGPEGEILLYYREGQDLFVKNCNPLMMIGSTSDTSKQLCEGKSNKVPLKSFKNEIRNVMNTNRLDSFYALMNQQEYLDYKKNGFSQDKLNEIQSEVDRLNAFIQAFKANTPMLTVDGILKMMQSGGAIAAFFDPVANLIEQTIDQMIANNPSVLKFSDCDCESGDVNTCTKSQFMYTILKKFDPNEKYPCNNIEECSATKQATKHNAGAVLYMRDKDFNEIWKDENTGLLWTYIQPQTMSYGSAQQACEKLAIGGKKWDLPSLDQYSSAFSHRTKDVLSHLWKKVWTKQIAERDHFYGSYGAYSLVFWHMDNYSFNLRSSDPHFFRCIANGADK